MVSPGLNEWTHWGRVTYISVSNLTITGSDNSLSPGRCQAIIWTNDGILLIGTLGTNFSEILSEIHTFSFKKMYLKTSSAKWRPFCLGLNVLIGMGEHHFSHCGLSLEIKRIVKKWCNSYGRWAKWVIFRINHIKQQGHMTYVHKVCTENMLNQIMRHTF